MASKGSKKAVKEALRERSRNWQAWRDSAVTLWAAADTLWQSSERRDSARQEPAPIIWDAVVSVSRTTADLGLQAPTSRPETESLNSGAPFGNLRIPALMLYGMAIENFLKALMVRFDLPVPRSHDLEKLAAAASAGPASLPDLEPLILRKFSAAITWYGRYPGPLDKHLEASVDPSGAAAVAPRFTSTLDDRILVVGFLEKLKKLFDMD